MLRKSCLTDEILSFQEGFYFLELAENGPRAVAQGVHQWLPIALPLDLTSRSGFITDLRYIIAGKIQQMRSWLPEFCSYRLA